MIIRNKLTLSNSVYSSVDMLIWKHVWCPACECIDASAGRYGVFMPTGYYGAV